MVSSPYNLGFGRKWLHVPDHVRILLDTPVAAEESHPTDAGDALADPFVLVLVRLVHERLRLDVAVEIVAHQVVVSMVDDRITEGRELPSVAKHPPSDRIEHFLQIRIQLEFPVRMGMAELIHVFRQVPKQEDVVLANLASDLNLGRVSTHLLQTKEDAWTLTLAPSQVPMISPPFSTNFMLLVPLASVPAVEMCSLISEAGAMISALLTL